MAEKTKKTTKKKTSKKTKSSKDKEKIFIGRYLDEAKDSDLAYEAFLDAGLKDEITSEILQVRKSPIRTREELDSVVKNYKEENYGSEN